MTKMNTVPPEFNPDYPGFLVPKPFLKSQLEIIEMVENGTFKPDAQRPEVEGREASQTNEV